MRITLVCHLNEYVYRGDYSLPRFVQDITTMSLYQYFFTKDLHYVSKSLSSMLALDSVDELLFLFYRCETHPSQVLNEYRLF